MLDYRSILRVSSDPDKSIRTMELELRSSHHTIYFHIIVCKSILDSFCNGILIVQYNNKLTAIFS